MQKCWRLHVAQSSRTIALRATSTWNIQQNCKHTLSEFPKTHKTYNHIMAYTYTYKFVMDSLRHLYWECHGLSPWSCVLEPWTAPMVLPSAMGSSHGLYINHIYNKYQTIRYSMTNFFISINGLTLVPSTYECSEKTHLSLLNTKVARLIVRNHKYWIMI